MKYSIILPYYKRPELQESLLSFVKHYAGRTDYEVVVVEDSKNAESPTSNEELLHILAEFKGKIQIKHITDSKVSFSPCHKYNLGAYHGTGEFVVLSSPEIVHESDILGGCDKLLAEDADACIVCACKAMDKDKFLTWYQHSKIRNVLFHFCSVLSVSNFIKVGGFDERYCDGIGFDDEDFVSRLIFKGVKIIPRDDLVTIHQEHNRDYIDNHRELVEVNRNLYLSQCGV